MSRGVSKSFTPKKRPHPLPTTLQFEPVVGGCFIGQAKGSAHNVVADKVLVALVRVNLHAPAVNIAGRVGRASLGADGRDTEEHIGLFADGVEEAGRGDV